MKKILKFDSEPLDAEVKIYYDQMGHYYNVYERDEQVMILEGFGCQNNVTANFVSDVNEKKQRIYVEVGNPTITYSNDNCDSVEEPSHSDYRDWKNWIENDMNDNSYELRIVHMGIINGSKTLISNEIIHLIKGKTISDGVDEAFELVKRQNDFGNKIISDIQQDKSFIKDYKIRISRDIQLILYLCASNADIEENPDQNKIYKFNHGIIKDKYREIKIYDVGYQLFSDIDNLEEVEPKKNSNNTGTSKSPHIRKAHWHHYWIGKENEKSKILKWLHPMFINLQKGKKSDKNKED